MNEIIINNIVLLIIKSKGVSQSSWTIDSLQSEYIKCGSIDSLQRKKASLSLQLCYYSIDIAPIKAFEFGKLTLDWATINNDKLLQAYANTYLSSIENSLGNRLKSIGYAIKSASIFRELEMYVQEGTSLIAIGNVFALEGDALNTLRYYHQALQVFKSYGDTLYYESVLNNIGEFYRKNGNTDSALVYYNLCLEYLENIKNSKIKEDSEYNKAIVLGNIGMVYLANSDYNKAELPLKQACEFFSINFDPYRKSVYQFGLGKLYILKGEFNIGEKLIIESLKIAKEEKLKEQIREFSLELSSFYEEHKNYPKSLFHYKNYKIYYDSIQNVENVRKIEQQQSQFQLTKKDEEITALNKINKLQRWLGLLLFGIIIIVIVFIFFLYSANKKIKASNKQITEQKRLVEKREKEKALLLRELNHRVKNNLQMVASLLNLHSRQLKGHPAAEALLEGKYRVEALTLIHQKLYRDDIDTKIDLKDYIEELTKNLVMNFGQNFDMELKLVPFIMKIDKAIPLGLVLNELVTNSLKYGQEDNESPKLAIVITKEAENVILTIKDNGKGLPDDFDFRKTDSFGLKLVHSLINQLGGKIDWNSKSGTCWTITLNTLKIS